MAKGQTLPVFLPAPSECSEPERNPGPAPSGRRNPATEDWRRISRRHTERRRHRA